MGPRWIVATIWMEDAVKEFDDYETALAYYQECTTGRTVGEAVFLAEIRKEWRNKQT